MNIRRCTFDELPDAMKTHVLYVQNIPAIEYRLAVWSEKGTLYYNNLKESEVERFITLIESKRVFLHGRTLESIYKRYGFAVYNEIREAHAFLVKKKREQIAESVVAEYVPIIEKAMESSSVPLSEPLLKAMSHAADKGRFKFKGWSTTDTYIYFMGYLLGAGKLKFEESLL